MKVRDLKKAKRRCQKEIESIKEEHMEEDADEIRAEIKDLQDRIAQLRDRLSDAVDDPELPEDAQQQVDALREEKQRIQSALLYNPSDPDAEVVVP